MKKAFITVLLTGILLRTNAQVFTQSSANGSITITPKGLQGKTNSTTNVTNVMLGNDALSVSAGGQYNTAIGDDAMKLTTTGDQNTALGCKTLANNTTGGNNVAIGYAVLFSNISGSGNTGVGLNALGPTTSSGNTAIGSGALLSNTNGENNTALGYAAGGANTTGDRNTLVGYNANVASGNLSNSIAIGNMASVNASNKAVIGNASVTTVGGYGNWSNYSDRRLKENIFYTDRLGLAFILKLKPASYNYVSDTNKRRRDGLIAQDVQAAMKELGVPFSGLIEDDDATKTLNLSYAELVLPLINGMKEQQTEINDLKKKLSRMEELEKRLMAIEANTNTATAPTGK